MRRPDGSLLTVRHDVFQESVSDLRTGFRAKVYFNLWTDADGRPLKFASSRTVGLREGYEDLAELAPTPIEIRLSGARRALIRRPAGYRGSREAPGETGAFGRGRAAPSGRSAPSYGGYPRRE